MTESLHRPVLIVIAGPNGSGKTTITSRILHHEWLENSVYINPDQVAQERFGDWNSADAVRQAARYLHSPVLCLHRIAYDQRCSYCRAGDERRS